MEATASGGLLILYGALSRDQTAVPPFHIFARNLTIRGVAEGDYVIVHGRFSGTVAPSRPGSATTQANPGMHSVELDITDAVTTNLLGPIRLTSALVEHLKKQPRATVIYNTSALAFVPLALAAVYSCTKAALHSYVLSQRYRLKGTSVRVLELAPPWVQTDLLNSNEEPRAMPLREFIEETIKVLGTDAEEILVESAMPFRNNPGPNESALVTQFNDLMIAAKPQ